MCSSYCISLVLALSIMAISLEEISANECKKTDHKYGSRLYEHTSVLYGLTKLANMSLVSPLCYDQLKEIQLGILCKNSWAMKILDASGTKKPGFIYGQNYWFGDKDLCDAAQYPTSLILSTNFERNTYSDLLTDVSSFPVKYRILYLEHNSPWQVELKIMSERVVHIGLCLPTACSSYDIKSLANSYVKCKHCSESMLYNMNATVMYVKDLQVKDSYFFKTSLVVLIGIIIFSLFVMLYSFTLRTEPDEVETQCVDNSTSKTSIKDHRNMDQAVRPPEDGITRFVQCFDCIENYRKIFLEEPISKNDIPIINGLRSIYATWILIIHVLWYSYFSIENKVSVAQHTEKLIFGTSFIVDVFFTISGFLQSYNFIKKYQHTENLRNNNLSENVMEFFRKLFCRLLRLGPPYLVIICLFDLLSSYVKDVSIFHIAEVVDGNCSKYWWRNLLFIQNLFPHEEMCANWTWSLACDVQFYILATFLLFLYTKYPNEIKYTASCLLVANIWWTCSLGLIENYRFIFDAAFASGSQLYINPFVRATPYIIGCIAGAYFAENESNLDISDDSENYLWCGFAVLFFLCTYPLRWAKLSNVESVALLVFGRCFYSISICWAIMASAMKRSCRILRVLESPILRNMNLITYSFYLLNPAIVLLLFSMQNSSTYIDKYSMLIMGTTVFVFSYIASIIFTVCFEMPYCNWSNKYTKCHERKTS